MKRLWLPVVYTSVSRAPKTLNVWPVILNTYKPRILTFRFFHSHIPGSWNYYALYQEVLIEQVQAQHESTNLVEVSD